MLRGSDYIILIKLSVLETGYWNAHNFYAPNGNPIYGSVSDYQPDVVIHDRKIITNSSLSDDSYRQVHWNFSSDWIYIMILTLKDSIRLILFT